MVSVLPGAVTRKSQGDLAGSSVVHHAHKSPRKAEEQQEQKIR